MTRAEADASTSSRTEADDIGEAGCGVGVCVGGQRPAPGPPPQAPRAPPSAPRRMSCGGNGP